MASSKKEYDKIICACHGGEPISISNFYTSYSKLFTGIGVIPICKKCIGEVFDDLLKKYKNDKHAIYKLCERLDVPFYNGVYEGTKNGKWKSYQTYFKNINSFKDKNRYGDCFDDGEIFNENLEGDGLSSFSKIDEETQVYWGRGLEEWEIEFLEKEIYSLKTDFECDDYGMEMIMKDISFINLEIYKSRCSGRDVGKLIKTRSDLMNDANLKPVQSTGADKNEKLSLGVFIRKWENEKPVKKDLDDEMKTYIDTFMVGHLAKMQGLKNEATDKYDKAIEEHTISFKDLKKEEDDEL